MNFFTVIFVAIASAVTSYFSDLFSKRTITKAIAIGLVAALAASLGIHLEHRALLNSKPSIRTRTSLSDERLDIRVVSDNPSLNSAVIGFHLPGHIHSVEKLHPEADARSTIYVEGEQTADFITNRVEIRIEEIIPKKELAYRVSFERIASPNIGYIDRDVYCLTYTWKHKDERYYEEEWRSLGDDSVVKPPYAQLTVIQAKYGPDGSLGLRFNVKAREGLEDGESCDVVWVNDPGVSSKITDDFGPVPRKEF